MKKINFIPSHSMKKHNQRLRLLRFLMVFCGAIISGLAFIQIRQYQRKKNITRELHTLNQKLVTMRQQCTQALSKKSSRINDSTMVALLRSIQESCVKKNIFLETIELNKKQQEIMISSVDPNNVLELIALLENSQPGRTPRLNSFTHTPKKFLASITIS